MQPGGVRSVFAPLAIPALQPLIRLPKTGAANGDRPMLFPEFYAFRYSRFIR